MGGDELAGLDIIDVRRTHFYTSGFFLEQECDTAVFIAPTAIEPLDGDLFREVGDGHGHLEFTPQFIGQGNIFAGQGEHKTGVVVVLPEYIPWHTLMQIPQASCGATPHTLPE